MSDQIQAELKEEIIKALRTVYDPEIPVNIYDLGLIYDVALEAIEGAPLFNVHIQMTLTAPGCPVAATFPGTVEERVREVEGVGHAAVELVWDPPWTQDKMTDAAKLQLGLL